MEELDESLDGPVAEVTSLHFAIFVPVFLVVTAIFYMIDQELGSTMGLFGIIVPLFLSSIVYAFKKVPPRYVRVVSSLGVVSLLILLLIPEDSDSTYPLVFSVSTLCLSSLLIGRSFQYFEKTMRSLRDQQGTSSVDLDSTFCRVVDSRLATTLKILGILLVLGYLLTLVSILLDTPSIFDVLFAFVSMTVCFGSLFYILVMFFLVHGPVQQQLRRRREAAATIATGPSVCPQQSQSETLVELPTPLMQSSSRLEDTSQETEDILIV